MTLWIANTTRQETELHVCLPENTKLLVRRISSGRQDELKGLSVGQEEAIIAHLLRYGGVNRKDLHGKNTRFQGMAFSTDRPFSENELRYGFEEVIDAAESRSVTEATKSALAADLSMRNADGSRISTSTEIEMIEEHPEKNSKRKSMRIRVDPEVSNSDVMPLQ